MSCLPILRYPLTAPSPVPPGLSTHPIPPPYPIHPTPAHAPSLARTLPPRESSTKHTNRLVPVASTVRIRRRACRIDAMAPQPDLSNRHENCIIAPMTANGDGSVIRVEHIVDALIVAAIVFFAIILGNAVVAFISGDAVYLTLSEVFSRLVTATVAFFLTFFAQWGRARGLEIKELIFGN